MTVLKYAKDIISFKEKHLYKIDQETFLGHYALTKKLLSINLKITET